MFTRDLEDNTNESIDESTFMSIFDKETVTTLSSLLFDMVSISYPDLDKMKVESFVMANMFTLIEPLSRVTFRQEKGNPRKTQAMVKG